MTQDKSKTPKSKPLEASKVLALREKLIAKGLRSDIVTAIITGDRKHSENVRDLISWLKANNTKGIQK